MISFSLLPFFSVVVISFSAVIFLSLAEREFSDVERMADLYYVPAALSAYAIMVMITVESSFPLSRFHPVQNYCYIGLAAMTMGGVNLAVPALLPKKYFKIVSRCSDSIFYIPFFYLASVQLDYHIT